MIETSGHLPECPWADRGYAFPCICDRLQACEARVRVNERDWRDQSFGLGYAAGLDAAREAVAKEAERGPLYSVRNSDDAQRGWDAMSRHALAAIDALREEKPPPLPPSVGVPSKPMWPLREEQK